MCTPCTIDYGYKKNFVLCNYKKEEFYNADVVLARVNPMTGCFFYYFEISLLHMPDSIQTLIKAEATTNG